MQSPSYNINLAEYDWRPVFESIRSYVLSILGSNADLDLAGLIALEFMGIVRLAPFIADENVTEVFCDGPHQTLYLDHKSYGRCNSAIRLTERETIAFHTLLEAFSGLTTTYTSPSLKAEAWILGKRIRVSVDTPPLSNSGFSFVLRKAGYHGYTLQDLCRSGAITPEAAAFLLATLEIGGNVTIVGTPGSGKTTLLNAIDAYLSPEKRRVYIEDAVESQDLTEQGYRQLKLVVEPLDSGLPSRVKTMEILKVLHRTPDLVVLGEIQSGEHSRALFQALASGLSCLQTFHATTPEQAVRRWVHIHKIPLTALEDLDCIVSMVRPSLKTNQRVVHRISEIHAKNGTAYVSDIFVRKSAGLVEVKPVDRTVSASRVIERGLDVDFAELYRRFIDSIRDALSSEKYLGINCNEGSLAIGSSRSKACPT